MLKQKMCKNLTQDVPQKDPGLPTGGLQTTNADCIFLFFLFFQNQPDSPISSHKNLSRLGFQKRVILFTLPHHFHRETMDKPAAFSGPLTFLPKGQSEVSRAPVLERPWAFCGHLEQLSKSAPCLLHQKWKIKNLTDAWGSDLHDTKGSMHFVISFSGVKI